MGCFSSISSIETITNIIKTKLLILKQIGGQWLPLKHTVTTIGAPQL